MRWPLGGSKKGDPNVNDDPNSTKKFPLSSVGKRGITRVDLEEQIGREITLHQGTPLVAADIIMKMFESAGDRELLNGSMTLQNVLLGNGVTRNTIVYLMEEGGALKQGEKGTESAEIRALWKRYDALVDGINLAKDPERKAPVAKKTAVEDELPPAGEPVEVQARPEPRAARTGTRINDDPKGIRKFRLSSAPKGITRLELQDRISSEISLHQGTPLDAADTILKMFESQADRSLLTGSMTLQNLLFGDESTQSPVLYLLEQAGAQSAATAAVAALRKRYDALATYVEQAHENEVIGNDDPHVRKKHEITGMPFQMTWPDIRDHLSGIISSSGRGREMDGAEQIMNLFSGEDEAALLQKSPRIRAIVLGSIGDAGPVGYLLAEARKGLGAGDEAAASRLEGLEQRFEEMKVEARGVEGASADGTYAGSETRAGSHAGGATRRRSWMMGG